MKRQIVAYYDDTLNKIVFFNGSKWVDANGYTAALSKGPTAYRPTNLTASDVGYEYYDMDIPKKIMWNGIGWVNLDGTTLS